MAAAATERPMPAVDGVEHRFLDARGLRVHFAEAGPPDGEPVVLLHGWPQHWYMWRNQIGPLAERYRVICPDLRGFGWTEAPPRGYEKQQFADDVLALLDALGLERVKLAGHDWGGITGFLLCLRHPERVERFVCLNSGGPWANVNRSALLGGWRFGYMVLLALPWLGRRLSRVFTRASARIALERPDAWSASDAASFVDQFAEPARGRAAQLTYRTFLLRELPRIMLGRFDDERLATPTLCLHGEGDVVLDPGVVRACERHADALEFELIPDAGHFVAEDAPELVTERMLEFFASSAPARRQPAPSAEAAA